MKSAFTTHHLIVGLIDKVHRFRQLTTDDDDLWMSL
jgi:hypothetical protein